MSDPADEDRLADLLLAWEERHERGEDVPAAELCADRPDLVPRLAARIDLLRRVNWVTGDGTPEPAGGDTPNGEPPVLAGRYRLDALIGEGGFGQVWRGFDLELRRPVAVKRPRSGRSNPGSEDAILAEARKVAALRCPGVVPVYDVGRHAGATFIVSELIEGEDLARRLGGGRLPVREAVRVVAEAARHLHQAHRLGFVHRDIKPANLLLGSDGRVLVTDFGIAVAADDPGGATDGAGTLAYMSPEQLFPDRSRVDARADVYALGVVLYQAVTGQLPFPATSPAILRHQILNAEPPSPRTVNRAVPTDLDRVMMRCLAKSPANRYPTAEALADDLSRCLRRGWAGRLTNLIRRPISGSAVATEAVADTISAGRVRGAGSTRPSRRWALLLAFGGLFGAATLGGMWYAFRPEASDTPAVEPVDVAIQIPEPGDEVRLFNGRDLTGWTFYPYPKNKTKELRVGDAVQFRDGVMALGHQRSYRICTAEKYKNFVLRLEYRHTPGGTVTPAGGAVLLRVSAPRQMAQYHLHVRLAPPYEGFVALPAALPPNEEDDGVGAGTGEWTDLEVKCFRRVVFVTVNGRPAGSTHSASQDEGYIGLASQGSDVEFRNIRLRPIR